MSRDENAGPSHNIKFDSSSYERVGQFNYLGTNLRNKNSIQEEIKSRMRSGNGGYHSVHNLLSSSLLFEYKDKDVQNYNFAYCFVCVCNLVAHIEG